MAENASRSFSCVPPRVEALIETRDVFQRRMDSYLIILKNQLFFFCWSCRHVHSLLMWRHEASRRLYLMLWLALSLTLVVPAAQLSTFVGFYLLFKLMVVDYVFYKFPRLRAKYDTSSFMWQTLPTDADLDARHKVEQVSHSVFYLRPLPTTSCAGCLYG